MRRASCITLLSATTLAVVAIAMPSSGLAQSAPVLNDEGGQVTSQGPDRAIIYDGEVVDGDLPRPSGDRITARHSSKHPSLIQLRVRFNDHLERLSRDI